VTALHEADMHPEHPRDWAQTYARRKAATRELLAAEKADAFLVTHLPHIRYLTGFSGSTAYLILHRQSEPVLITDFRYREQAHEEITLTQAATVTIVEKEYLATLASVIADLKIRALAFDPKYLTCDLFAKIKRSNAEIKLDPVDNACDGLLRRKDEWEIDRISRASDIADQLFERMLKWPLTELREQDIAARLDYEGRLLESEGASFPSIIAAGSNAAKPHAPTGARKPRTGEMLLFDYGQRWAGYCSDMTRTISLGKADSKLTEIYALVRKAQEQALAVVGPGKTCAEVDEAVKDVHEGRTAVYADITLSRLYPTVMTDDDFNPKPDLIAKGLKWHPVADYVLCILDFAQGRAPTDEAEFKAVTLELLEKLIAASFPNGGLKVTLKDEGHHHHDIYVNRRADL